MGHGGARPGAGRTKGKVGKRTKAIEDMLKELDCCPIEGMVKVANRAMKGFKTTDAKGNVFMKKDYALAGSMYKELVQYIAPKLKAVEHTGQNGDSINISSTIKVSSPVDMPFIELLQESVDASS